MKVNIGKLHFSLSQRVPVKSFFLFLSSLVRGPKSGEELHICKSRFYKLSANKMASRTCSIFSKESAVIREPIFPLDTV